jgi:Zn-dependent protease with chaperone function
LKNGITPFSQTQIQLFGKIGFPEPIRININRTYAVEPQTVVGAGFFRDFSLVAQSLDQPALTGFFILKCVNPDKYSLQIAILGKTSFGSVSMASVPQNSTRADLKSLKAGLAALKQGNVERAIALLESVTQTSPHSETFLHAQMGLVVAYDKIGQTDRAIALCRELSQSHNPKIQQWATRTLDRLATDSLQPLNESQPTPPPTGFVPFSEEERQNLSAPVSPPTGFVPFSEQAPEAPQHDRNPPQNPTPILDRHIPENRESYITLPPSPSQVESLDEPLSEEGAASGSPPLASLPEATTADTPPPPRSWRNAERADRPKPLKGSKIGQLRWMQIFSTIALFALILTMVKAFAGITNELIAIFPLGLPFQGFYNDPTRFLAIVLLLFLIASPWLLDALLQFAYGWKPLSLKTLGNYSPEATKMLRQVCRQKKISLPTLGILPDAAPVIFTYGHFPATARIAVSQGLLERLADDEIATLYAAELAHILYGDVAVMSLGLVLTQIPYTLYWKASQFGDRLQEEAQNRKANRYQFYSLTISVWTFAVISAIAYGFYWLLRLPLLPLSRQRLTESDRFATATTGNPNGFARALLKLTIGIAEDIQQQQHTSYLLESFEGVMPVSHRQAIFLGSAYPHIATESLLAWDLSNPQRHQLTTNNSHPLLGERLAWLTRCAQFWKLEPEFDLEATPVRRQPQPSRLWLQGSPFFGLLAGLGLGVALTLVGWIAQELDVRQMGWIFRDRAWLIPGLMLTGFSIGTLIRINAFFPDLKPTNLSVEPNFLELLSHPQSLPIDSRTVRFSGKLLGRRGIANWLGQDLIVQTEKISVKLHDFSKFGPVGNLLPQGIRPSHWVDRELIVTGWWRRGATVWIDVDTFKIEKVQLGAFI